MVDLDFLSEVVVDGGRILVSFRLPTFWCSANFAWIMAEDMRATLSRLGWVERADIRLVDHFAADRINAGIGAGGGFRTAFGDEAADDLASLREAFRWKAFLGRMSALIEALRDAGRSDDEMAAMTIVDLASERYREFSLLIDRFLELRAVYGGPSGPGDAAFRTMDGTNITATALPGVLRDFRMTRRSVEANGEMCRILLKARYEAGVAGRDASPPVPASSGRLS